MSRRSRLSLVTPALAVLLIGAACAGGGGDTDGTGGTPGTGGGLTACEALDKLQRYRYAFSFRIWSPQPETPLDESELGTPAFALPPNNPTFEWSQEYEGSVVNPERIGMVVKNAGQPDLEMLFIGEQGWSKVSGEWTAGSAAASIPFPPNRVCSAVMTAADPGVVAPVQEDLNGLTTDHYRLDRIDGDTAGVLLGSESDMGRLLKVYETDVWLADDGWPARLETRSEGTYPSGRKLFIEITLEVKDANAEDIKLEPPI